MFFFISIIHPIHLVELENDKRVENLFKTFI